MIKARLFIETIGQFIAMKGNAGVMAGLAGFGVMLLGYVDVKNEATVTSVKSYVDVRIDSVKTNQEEILKVLNKLDERLYNMNQKEIRNGR